MEVLVTGYPSIDHIARVSHSPGVGETARLYTLPDQVTYGGCGLNVGVALRRMGFEVGAAVVLGDDPHGVAYRAHLGETGIDTSNVTTLPGEYTSQSYLFLSPDGQYQNFFLPGAADAWNETLELYTLEQCQYALVTVGQLAYNLQFIDLLQAAGVPVVWMMKPDVYAYPPDVLNRFVDASDYVIMNHIEAEYVMFQLGYTSLAQLLGGRCNAVIMTRGAKGANVIDHAGVVTVPAVPVEEVVDPTGAGDGFAAGFLAGLLTGVDAVESAQLGAVIASFVLQDVGCQTNLPDWASAMARYRFYFGEFGGEE